MRSALIVLTVLIAVLTSSMMAARADAEVSVAPDLRGYLAVVPDAFVICNEAYFQTPDGLLCAIQPDRGIAGCDGRLPGLADGVDEIVLSADAGTEGLRATANHGFVKSTGDAAPLLREGQKLTSATSSARWAPARSPHARRANP